MQPAVRPLPVDLRVNFGVEHSAGRAVAGSRRIWSHAGAVLFPAPRARGTALDVARCNGRCWRASCQEINGEPRRDSQVGSMDNAVHDTARRVAVGCTDPQLAEADCGPDDAAHPSASPARSSSRPDHATATGSRQPSALRQGQGQLRDIVSASAGARSPLFAFPPGPAEGRTPPDEVIAPVQSRSRPDAGEVRSCVRQRPP